MNEHKYQVGDIFVRFEEDVILIAEIIDDLVVGYWGSDLRNVGYVMYINQKVKAGAWKHYPVVK